MLSKNIWELIKLDAKSAIKNDNDISSLINYFILDMKDFPSALCNLFATKLMGRGFLEYKELTRIAREGLRLDTDLVESSAKDIQAFYERDPACTKYFEPFLFYKGFIAVQSYRIARAKFLDNKVELSKFIQMRSSELFGVDLHPAASIGSGLMIDHAHSIVVGATSVIEDNVSMLHSVTLGGTGKETGDRHPKIGKGVLLGAGCSILGNISIGYCSKVASGSVVLTDVPPCKTVAGIPAKIVGVSGCESPSLEMDHSIP